MDINHQIKNDKWSIVEIDSFIIENLKKEILSYDKEWFLDLSRQQTYKAHKDTQMYRLMFANYSWKIGDQINIIQSNTLKNLNAIEEFNIICESLEKKYNAKTISAEFIRLNPNSVVMMHMDQGDLLKVSRRCHIPLVTNENVFFQVLNNKINMKEGICYEINNAMPHGVENNSSQDRIHLIIDFLPNEYFI